MPTYYLDPNASVSNNWTSNGTFPSNLADAVRQPTAPSTASNFISSSTAAQVAEADCSTFTLGASETVTSIKLWYYGAGGTKRAADVGMYIGTTLLTATSQHLPAGGAAGWRSLTFTGSATQSDIDALRCRFTVVSTAGGGGASACTVYAAYIEITTTLPVTEQVTNQHFEADLTGWSDDSWVAATMSRITTWAHDGLGAMRWTLADATANRGNGFRSTIGASAAQCKPSTAYTFRCFANVISKPAGWNGIRIRIYWYDAAGTNLSTSQPATGFTGTGETCLNYTVTSPAGAYRYSFGVSVDSGTDGATSDVYVDDFRTFEGTLGVPTDDRGLAIYNDGPQAWWRGDDAGPTTVDDYEGSRDGTASNVTFGVTGSQHNALSFNGTTSYFTAPLDSLGTFFPYTTVEFWIKTNTSAFGAAMGTLNTGTSNIIGVYLNSLAEALSAGKTEFHIRDPAGATVRGTISTNIYDNAWHHVVWQIKDDATFEVYVDNVLQTVTYTIQGLAFQAAPVAFDYPLAVGARNNRGTIDRFGSCSIEDLAWYSGHLTTTEIQTHYQAGAPTNVTVGKDLTLQWSIIGAVGRSLTLPWTIRTMTGKDLTTPWTIRTVVGLDRTFPWTIRAAIGKDLTLPWTMRTFVGKSLTVPWTIRTMAGKDITLQWYLRTMVGKDLSPQWYLRGFVGKDLSLAWYLRTFAGKDLTLAWDILGALVAVGRDLSLPWTIRTLVGADHTFPWTVRTLSGRDLSVPWAIRGFAGRDLTLPWSIRTLVGRSLTAPWTLRTAVGDDLVLPWTIRTAVGDDLTLQWYLRTLAGKDLNLAWSIGAANVTVGRSLDLLWTLRSLAGRDLVVPWTLRTLAGRSVSLPWTLRTLAGRDITVPWTIRSTAGKDLTAPWMIRVLAGKDLQTPWTVRTLAGKDLELQWALGSLQVAGASLSLQWQIQALTGRDLGLQWYVRSFAGRDLVLPWTIRTTVGKDTTLQWTVRSAAGQDLTVEWDVRGLAGRDLNLQWWLQTHVGRDLTTPYTIRTTAGKSLTLPWWVLVAAGRDLTVLWTLYAAAGQDLELRWRINEIVADVYGGSSGRLPQAGLGGLIRGRPGILRGSQKGRIL